MHQIRNVLLCITIYVLYCEKFLGNFLINLRKNVIFLQCGIVSKSHPLFKFNFVKEFGVSRCIKT